MKQELYENILNSYPYSIVFVDNDYKIQYLNTHAEIYYYQKMHYTNLLGKSIFDCHKTEEAKLKIKNGYEYVKKTGKDLLISDFGSNKRIYLQGVKNKVGNWIGFIERFELNIKL